MSKTEIDYCLQDPKSLKVLHRFDFAIHQLMFLKKRYKDFLSVPYL